MATIRKRGDTYQIRVSCGYDIKGIHKEMAMTWTPDEGALCPSGKTLTARQIEKELQKQIVMFEEQCKKGIVTTNVKF